MIKRTRSFLDFLAMIFLVDSLELLSYMDGEGAIDESVAGQ